jgi:hypothetical protein
MSAFNQFFSKCQRFLESFVEEEYPSPTYERFSALIVERFLHNPDVSYSHRQHPFHRYAAEELDEDDSIANLAADMEGSLVQENLGHLRLAFFAKQGINRGDLEWLLSWFIKYADATTGLSDYDESEWEEDEEQESEEEEEEEEEEEQQLQQQQQSQQSQQQQAHDADWDALPPPPLWNPHLIYNTAVLANGAEGDDGEEEEEEEEEEE